LTGGVIVKRGVVLLTALAAVACAPPSFWRYGPDRQPLAEFEHRVEKVFRLQNKMTSEIMARQDFDDDGSGQTSVADAEQQMQKDCNDLNDYAIREIDGRSQSVFLRHRVEQSVEDCERSAHQVEKLLQQEAGPR
jgi:hypothetical protein